MSITLKDGGPAFPQKEPLTSDHAGMSLRQMYAMNAPQAPDWFRFEPENTQPGVPPVPQKWGAEQRAEFAYIKDGSLDIGAALPEVREFWRSYGPAREKLEAWRLDMRSRKFFAWRWFYADMMLETERGGL